MTKRKKKRKEIEKVLQTKMDLTKLTQNEEIPIVVTTNFDVDLFVKGYHEYKSIWTPKIGEIVSTEREPGNVMDKYAVCVNKENEIVGHLTLGKDGKFAKIVLFLRAGMVRAMLW